MGIGDFEESFIEHNHQRGVNDNSRVRAMRDRIRKFKAFSNWEEIRKHPDVVKATLKADEKRSRSLKRKPRDKRINVKPKRQGLN